MSVDYFLVKKHINSGFPAEIFFVFAKSTAVGNKVVVRAHRAKMNEIKGSQEMSSY